MSDRTILITGATGYIGGRVARRLATGSEDTLVLWLRARSSDDAEARTKGLIDGLGSADGRLCVHWGNLRHEHPFETVDPRAITDIVHTAALTDFGAERGAALATNTLGTARLLDFARRCPQLERLNHLSTIYVAGLEDGTVPEAPLPEPRHFANPYEESKWQAERLLVEEFHDLPWRIIRLPTVIARDRSGNVDKQNAVHKALRLLFNGLLPVVPGRPEVPLYLATCEELLSPLISMLTALSAHSVANLVPDANCPSTLGKVIATAHQVFQIDKRYRARVPNPPPWCDWPSFDALASASRSFSTDLVRQAQAAITPFARQLYIHHDVEAERCRKYLIRNTVQPREALMDLVCRNLISTNWRIQS